MTLNEALQQYTEYKKNAEMEYETLKISYLKLMDDLAKNKIREVELKKINSLCWELHGVITDEQKRLSDLRLKVENIQHHLHNLAKWEQADEVMGK